MNTVIRVGEKNNFNQTDAEFKELEKYSSKGSIFVNSNSFQPIDGRFPSIVTINPYMKFQAITGDLSNVKAVRIKIFRSSIQSYRTEIIESINFCVENNLPILLTYMRYRSKKTAEQYSGDFRQWYKWEKNYFRPTIESKEFMKEYVLNVLELTNSKNLLNECDSKGLGCPECGNCHKLTYGYKTAEIKALNLSISGIADKNGKMGLCPFNCPDCFAKIVTYGKRPACDKLITNKKITGKI